MHGEKDLLLPFHMAAEVHKAIPNSRFEVIPNVGHTLNLEAVPQSLSMLKKFLEDKETGAV